MVCITDSVIKQVNEQIHSKTFNTYVTFSNSVVSCNATSAVFAACKHHNGHRTTATGLQRLTCLLLNRRRSNVCTVSAARSTSASVALRAGQPRYCDSNLAREKRFLVPPKRPDHLQDPPRLLSPGRQAITHFDLVPRFRMRGTVQPLPHITKCRAHAQLI
jgi:hypothetical protein